MAQNLQFLRSQPVILIHKMSNSDQHLIDLIKALKSRQTHIKLVGKTKIELRVNDIKKKPENVNPVTKTKNPEDGYTAKHVKNMTKWVKFWATKQFPPEKNIMLGIIKQEAVDSESQLPRQQAAGCNVDENRFTFGSLSGLSAPPPKGRQNQGNAPKGDKRMEDQMNIFRQKLDKSKGKSEAIFEQQIQLLNNLAISKQTSPKSDKPVTRSVIKKEALEKLLIPSDKFSTFYNGHQYSENYQPVEYHVAASLVRNNIKVKGENKNLKLWDSISPKDYSPGYIRSETSHANENREKFKKLATNPKLFQNVSEGWFVGEIKANFSNKKKIVENMVSKHNNLKQEAPAEPIRMDNSFFMDFGLICNVKRYDNHQPVLAAEDANFKFPEEFIYEMQCYKDFKHRVEESVNHLGCKIKAAHENFNICKSNFDDLSRTNEKTSAKAIKLERLRKVMNDSKTEMEAAEKAKFAILRLGKAYHSLKKRQDNQLEYDIWKEFLPIYEDLKKLTKKFALDCDLDEKEKKYLEFKEERKTREVDQIFYHENSIFSYGPSIKQQKKNFKKGDKKNRVCHGFELTGKWCKFRIVLGDMNCKCEAVDISVFDRVEDVI